MAARRPIAARDTGLAQAVAALLIRQGASPDAISLAGMACGVAAGLCFAMTAWFPTGASALWLLGAMLVALRLAANMLDGMVAIGRGIASPRGELFNELPDRVSDTAVLAGVGLAADALALGLGTALAATATAHVRAVTTMTGAPADFGGPMAKPQRMACIIVLALWIALAPDAWHSLLGHDLARLTLVAVTLLSLLTAGHRLRRGARALVLPS